jgi:hypothetical protein
MPHYLRQRVLLVGCALYLTALAWTGCNEVIKPALEDYYESRRWQLVLEQAEREAAELDRQAEKIRQRRLARDELCRDLIAGKITLAQAGRRLRDLPDQPIGFVEKLRIGEEGDTDEQRLCNHIIDRACNLLHSEPVKAEALRRRLKAELRASESR